MLNNRRADGLLSGVVQDLCTAVFFSSTTASRVCGSELLGLPAVQGSCDHPIGTCGKQHFWRLTDQVCFTGVGSDSW